MPRKAFHIGIDIDIHAVTCPGVWLCPKGDAMLQISMLGASAHTKRVEPNFPLLFHERFHFRKTLTGVTSLAELQSELSKRVVHLRLVQWQVHGCRCVLLASFRSPLADLLYPQPASRGLLAGVDVDLLMETTACFPGIIAPKVEVSTKVVIEEMVNYPVHAQESAAIVNHKTLSSKRTTQRQVDKVETKTKPRACSTLCGGPRIRQKPVCHARPRVKCYSCKQRVTRVQKPRVRDETHYVPYCSKCGDVVEEKGVKQGKVLVKESNPHSKTWETACPCVESPRSKSVCDCKLCRKYHDLFNSPTSSVFSQPKSPRSKFDRSPSPPKKDRGCSCISEKTEGPQRIRAGFTQEKSDCPCLNCPSLNESPAKIGDYITELLKQRPQRDDEYRAMLKADLETKYKQLYERVSRRSNRRQS
ncbi:uncharacterized protein LOC128994837 isoform X1 [Macrosteles quadrilineatus]|uniref:uncharacterized protein LOC128994837 isoform X1 n=2 Tax=Macrosteles quadrilineatus TaxID=74068 RepID=UPI0023E281E6|nr:uncharacterized protein LOC128994837 isoform X1 [Macrosteles quadrilineatus]